MLLRADAHVTEFALRSGAAEPYQAVLQAGTAVLVDERGLPRVRCASGNPLTGAGPLPDSPRSSGDSWPAYNPAAVVTITAATGLVAEWGLVDLTDTMFRRPAGSDGSADFDQVPASAPLWGTYALEGRATTCTGLVDSYCSNPGTNYFTLTVNECSGNTCAAHSTGSEDVAFLVRSGSSWTAMGSVAGYSCSASGSDVSSPATFSLTLEPTAAEVVATRWTATGLKGTLRNDIEPNGCTAATVAWELSGSRS